LTGRCDLATARVLLLRTKTFLVDGQRVNPSNAASDATVEITIIAQSEKLMAEWQTRIDEQTAKTAERISVVG
jgi:hypothetical protein